MAHDTPATFIAVQPSPPWVRALAAFVAAADAASLPYLVSGGAAAVLLGVYRDVHDVDIDMDLTAASWDAVVAALGAAASDVVPPAPHRAAVWDVTCASAAVQGVTVDVTHAASVRMYSTPLAAWVDVPADTSSFTAVNVVAPDVGSFVARVTPLAAMCAYKSGLSRDVDRLDLLQLRAMKSGTQLLPSGGGGWVHGAAGEPEWQTVALDDDTFVLRQSKTTDYEGNFVYLLVGRDRAMLFDTGATRTGTLADVVDRLLAPHRSRRADFPLVVAHTHGHGDHVAGDGLFAGRAGARVVGASPEAVAAEFGLPAWPDGEAVVDLGDRELRVFPTPGHEPAHVMVYDPRWGMLLSGDHFYRGRLYVADAAAYVASVQRAVAFCDAHPVTWVLGCHIEMGCDPDTGDAMEYPTGTTFQPHEPPLQLHVDHLRKLAAVLATRAIGTDRILCGEFIVHPK